jgi:hypothetical protein
MPTPISSHEQNPDEPVQLAIAPFDEWTYEDANNALKHYLPEKYTEAELFSVYKDHFQKGRGWIGPGEALDNRTNKIYQQFAPEDAIGEVLQNIENAFSEPQIGTASKNQDDSSTTKGEELVRFLSVWWDKRRMQELVQDRQRTGAWAGWANLRLWIPWRFLRQTGDGVTVPTAPSFEDALNMIFVSGPSPDTGAMVIDQATQDVAAIYLDKEVEYSSDGSTKTFERAELHYLDPNRSRDEDASMIMRFVYSNKDKPDVRVELPLQGHLLTSEMRTRVVITEPVMRTQRQLNFVATLIGRIVETAGFRERYIHNAKPQGIRYSHDEGDSLPDGAFLERDEEGRLWRVVPQVRTLGAATVTELIGLPQMDQTGETRGNQMPQVTIAEPVDPKPYTETLESIRRRILRMCQQGHLGGTSNAETSGIAYEQARSVFEKDLEKRRVSSEGMLRDLLTVVVLLAELISNKVGEYSNTLRITVDQHINPGPRSPDLVRLDLEAYAAGGMSQLTLISKLGIEDTDAETKRIRESSTFIMGLIEKVTASQGFTKESMIKVMALLEVPAAVVAALEVEDIPEPIAPPVEE